MPLKKPVKEVVDVQIREERPKRAATKRPLPESPVVLLKKPKSGTTKNVKATETKQKIKSSNGRGEPLAKKEDTKAEKQPLKKGKATDSKEKEEKKKVSNRKVVADKDIAEEPVPKKQATKRKAAEIITAHENIKQGKHEETKHRKISKEESDSSNKGKAIDSKEKKNKKAIVKKDIAEEPAPKKQATKRKAPETIKDKTEEIEESSSKNIKKKVLTKAKAVAVDDKEAVKEPVVQKGKKRLEKLKEKEPEEEPLVKKGTKKSKEVAAERKKEDVKLKPSKTKGEVKTKSSSDQQETTKKAPANKVSSELDSINYECDKLNEDGKPWNLKITSWNVDGLRAWISKGGHQYINYEKPDILCIQESRCQLSQIPDEINKLEGYHSYWHCADKAGYSGVGILSKRMPRNVSYGLGDETLDDEARIITAEYSSFYLICTYVPNAGRGLVTLPKRLQWNDSFRKHVNALNEKKPVVICGDLNVAHNEIDLKNPKTNKKNAGFTIEERGGMTDLLGDGYIDTFRYLYPETQAFTFWTYMMNARAKDVGWRLDYFLISERLKDSVCDNVIRKEVFGSDHCPITLFINIGGAPRHLVDESYSQPTST